MSSERSSPRARRTRRAARGSSPNISSPPPASSAADPALGSGGDADPSSDVYFGDVPLDPRQARVVGAADDEEADDGEDLIGDNMADDYRPIAELDRYDPTLNVDDEGEYEDDHAARAAAERALDARDETAGGGRRRARYAVRGLGSSELDDGQAPLRGDIFGARRRARAAAAAAGGRDGGDGGVGGGGGGGGGGGRGGGGGGGDDDGGDEGDDDDGFNLDDPKGSVREWIQRDGPRRKIARKFSEFLRTFVDERGTNVYAERIRHMCAANRESLHVSYAHLVAAADMLAMWVADYPTEILRILDEVAMSVVLDEFPHYDAIVSEVHVRITDLPIEDSLRDLRHIHLNALVRVTGVVTRRTGVFPQLKYVKYDCGRCGQLLGPFYQPPTGRISVGQCPACHSPGPFTVNSEQTVYRNFQKVTLQETPGTVPPGRLPRYKEVVLLWDLIDAVRPGEEVAVTGIYRNNFDMSLSVQNGFPVFATVLEANFVQKKDDQYSSFRLTDDDKAEIRALAAEPGIAEKIFNSIAPSIYGHRPVKTAIALAMFGGEAKDVARHRIRGDINVLIMGDPGVAKSQFLKYVEKTAHRAVFTTGQGASAVGLTAAVRRDPVTNEWTLEGGALVLADHGCCLIDEFDKMSDQDRVSIHEAMEQQTISISKAGIVTTLQARCAIIAAANPIKGRYDSAVDLMANVDLTEPILSRFDILCVVKDEPDPVEDDRLSMFIVSSHMANHPANAGAGAGADAAASAAEMATLSGETVPQDLLRKYIMFAKQECHPKMTDLDDTKITSLYADMRRESKTNQGLPMTVRHVESVIRMAEAHARMHLRGHVSDDDVNLAIKVMLDSFIGAQKFQVKTALRKRFQRYLSFRQAPAQVLLHVLNTMVRDNAQLARLMAGPDAEPIAAVEIDVESFEAKAREMEITDAHTFYASALFADAGYALAPDGRAIVYQFTAVN